MKNILINIPYNTNKMLAIKLKQMGHADQPLSLKHNYEDQLLN